MLRWVIEGCVENALGIIKPRVCAYNAILADGLILTLVIVMWYFVF